jgi:hypothetical protein
VTAFWDTTPYSLIALMMEAVRTSETSVYFVTTRRYIPEGCNLQIRRRENVKSYLHFDLNFYSSVLYITSYLYNNKLTPWRKNPKIHHRTHNSPPPVPVLSQSIPIHTPQANLPKIHSDPIFPPTPWSSQWSLSFGLSIYTTMHVRTDCKGLYCHI